MYLMISDFARAASEPSLRRGSTMGSMALLRWVPSAQFTDVAMRL